MASSTTSLRGYEQHGVKFVGDSGESEKYGSCPLCGKTGHFYANTVTKLWNCKSCGMGGNYPQFLQEVVEHNLEGMTAKARKWLMEDRGITKKSTLTRWRVGYDGYQYTFPVYNVEGNLTDVRRYNRKIKSQSSYGCKTFLMGVEWMNKTGTVYICEGEWDAVALDECVHRLGEEISVVGVPGSKSFSPEWAAYFRGRDVIVAMDNDDQGKLYDQRIAAALRGNARSILFVHWPSRVPDGYDVRDLYKAKGKETLSKLQKMLKSEPRAHPTYTVPQSTDTSTSSVIDIRREVVIDGEGVSSKSVRKRFSKWMNLADPDVIDVTFGSVLANRIPGDPLWLMLVAASGGGKTEVLMSLDGAPLVVSLTSLTPHSLVSGSRDIGGGDPSLIPKLNGRVLIIKDFTAIMSMNQVARDEVLGVLRDAYDRKTEKAYGTGLIRSYRCSFGIVGGVTPAIDMLPTIHQALGERFLRYRVRQMGGLDANSEEAISTAIDNIEGEEKMRSELCAVANDALNFKVEVKPKLPPNAKQRLIKMAQWVALMRTPVSRDRYTSDVTYRPSPEVGTRLAKQLTKLAYGIALFRHKDTVGGDVMRIVARVARDTIPENPQIVFRSLYLHRNEAEFFETMKVCEWTKLPQGTVTRILEDLVLLRAVNKRQVGYRAQWAVSKTMRGLMEETGVYQEDEEWRRKEA